MNQAEVIDLRYEPSGAVQAAKVADDSVQSIERSATRAGAAMEKTVNQQESAILRIVDRSRSGSERIIASIEKRAQGLKSPLDQLEAQRSQALDRIGGDTKGIDRVNAAFSMLIANQKKIDLDQRLDKAAAASRNAAKEADVFQAALSRVNQQQKQSAALRQAVVSDVARRVASPAERLLQDRSAALQKVSGDPAAVATVTANFSKLIAAEKAAQESAKGLELGDKIKRGLEDPIAAGGAAISGLASKIGAVGIIAAAAFAGIGFAAKEAFDFVAEQGEKAKSIANLADILDTTEAEAQRLDAMAKIAGVDIQGLTTFMRGLSKALTEGGDEGKKNAQALLDLGVHARDSQGNLKGTIELLTEIAHAGEKLDTKTFEAKLTSMGARGAIALIPLLKHFDEVDAAAREAGAGLQGNVINQLEEADDKVKQLSVKWDLLKQTFAAKIAPIIIPIAVSFTTNLKKGFHFDPFNAIDPLGFIQGQAAEAAKKEVPAEVKIEQPTPFTGDQLRGQAIKKQFEAQNTIAAIKLQIEDKERDLKAAEAKFDQLGPDAASSVVLATQKQVLALREQDDALKLNLKTLQELPERQKAAKQAAIEANAAELSGISKIIAERNKQIEQLSTVTENGKTGRIDLARQAPGILASVEAETQAKIRIEQRKTADEMVALDAKTASVRLENDRSNLRTEEDLADAHLALLESKELLSRREIENERLRIHKQAIDSVAALDKKQLEDAAALEIRQIRQHQDLATDPRDKSADFARIVQVREQLALKTGQIDQQAAAARSKADEDLDAQRILRDRQFSDQSVALQAQNIDREAALRESALGHQRDIELDNLAFIDQQTLSGKLAVEEKRLGIETQFLKQSEALQLDSVDRRLNTELALLDIQARREGISDETRLHRRELLEQEFATERLGIEQDTEAAITTATLKEAAARADAIRQHNLTVFDDLKRESEGVFDAMLTKGQNIFQAIGNSLKNALLTAIKDVVTSRVAASLTELVTGQKVTLVQENQGSGPIGKILTALGVGAKPVFGNQPTFKTKLDQPNHLGDVQLDRGAVPVVLVGQSERRQQSGPSSLAFGLGGATAALAAVLGLGAIAGTGAPAAAAPAGIVQSTFSALDFGNPVSFTGPGQVFGSQSVVGGPGGTSGFAGPVSNVFSGISGGGFPGVNAPVTTPPFAGGSQGGFGGILSSLKNIGGLKGILTNLGNIGISSGAGSLPVGIGGDTAAQAAGIPGLGDISPLGASGGSSAIGGLAGGALLAGGGILAANGLQRGGIGGLLETTAGGAAIGAKFGGPIGALIGAGVGALAGTIRLFIKSGAEKVVSKVKQVYGIDIDKKFAQDPILAIIKQNFGGNVDVGIRSPQVRDLLELYATTTDQKSAGIVNRILPSTFANQGGQLVNVPNVGLTGAPVAFSAGSATGNGISFGLGVSAPSAAPAPAAAPSQNVIVQSLTLAVGSGSLGNLVDGRAASVIQSSGRLVAASANTGQKDSASWRQTAAAALQPNFITS